MSRVRMRQPTEPGWSSSVAVPCVDDMDRAAAKNTGSGYPRGEGALGDLAQLLVDNPWMKQALQVAFGARERASQAGAARSGT